MSTVTETATVIAANRPKRCSRERMELPGAFIKLTQVRG